MTTQHPDEPTDEPPDAAKAPARSTDGINVNRGERLVSAAFGGALLTLGLRRRSLGGAATALAGGWLFYRGFSGHSRLYQALGRSTADGRERHEAGAPSDATEVERSITIGKSGDELYEIWREPQQLARIVGHFAEVTSTSEDRDRQHWVVRGPFGRSAAWDAKIVEDRPDEFLRWKSVPGAELPNEGSVRFRPAPGDRGTEVTLRFRFDPPGGALGDAAVKILGVAPGILASTALRRFKSLAEAGEIPTLERNPSARGSGDIL